MNINLSLMVVKRAIIAFLHRFHVMIFVVTVLGGLIVVILLLNSIVVRSGESNGYQPPDAASGTFDQETIKKIEELKTRNQGGSQLDLSNGRTNPFVE